LAATSCLACVWFFSTLVVCHTSLIIWPTCHRVNIFANFYQSLTSNFLATLCGYHTLPNFGLANCGWEPNKSKRLHDNARGRNKLACGATFCWAPLATYKKVSNTTWTRQYADGPELCRRLFVGAVGVARWTGILRKRPSA
jgi:hypothetical protein